MADRDSLTHARLRELLDYDPETGFLTWRVQSCPQCPVGSRAGNGHKSGYWRVQVGGRKCYYSRVVWFWATGAWPIGEIDHEDRDKSNHRWGNLRDLTHGQNLQNIHAAQRNSSTGIRGVWHQGKKFVAAININGMTVRIGTFKTKDEAQAARAERIPVLHPFASP